MHAPAARFCSQALSGESSATVDAAEFLVDDKVPAKEGMEWEAANSVTASCEDVSA